MANAVKAMWQDMQQEPADELMRRERHDALPLRTIAAVVFVAEGDAGLVERNQTLVGDGDTVGVAREVGLSVICVQKVPLTKVGKINEIAPRAGVISLI
jgi:hypothetical protein